MDIITQTHLKALRDVAALKDQATERQQAEISRQG